MIEKLIKKLNNFNGELREFEGLPKIVSYMVENNLFLCVVNEGTAPEYSLTAPDDSILGELVFDTVYRAEPDGEYANLIPVSSYNCLARA